MPLKVFHFLATMLRGDVPNPHTVCALSRIISEEVCNEFSPVDISSSSV